MKLYKKLPMSVTVDGKTYRIRPYFNRVLAGMDVLQRDDWTDGQKFQYLKWLFIRGRCKEPVKVILATINLLLPKNDIETKRLLDFDQDAEYIYAAFLQTYGINLFRVQDKLHWWEFSALLSALPQDTRMSEIVDLRDRPVPEPTKYNRKMREQIIRAKAKWRIKISEQEREKEYQQAMHKLAEQLITLAKR